jgi:hypothetical protein
MYFVSIYGNRRMKPVKIVLRREEGRGRTVEVIPPTKNMHHKLANTAESLRLGSDCKYHIVPGSKDES